MGSAIKNQISVKQEGTLPTAGGTSGAVAYGLPFWLSVAYLILEYGRPQDSLPGVGSLHLPALLIISLGLALLTSGAYCPG